jgi:tetratricopeptide (TPR) repeat protein
MGARPELALLYIELGKLDCAAKQIARCDEIVSTGEDWRVMAGHHARASAVYFATVQQYERAEHLFAGAVGTFNQFSSVWDEADTLHYWGRALISADENKRAIEKLERSVDIYRRHAAGQRWIDHVMADLPHQSTPHGVVPRTPVSDTRLCTFRWEGNFWTISHGDRTFRLKDMKGLRYIAHLLAHRGQEFHVLDLITAIDGTPIGDSREETDDLRVTNNLGDAGEILDQRSKADYRRRRDQLRDALNSAESANDHGLALPIRAELEMLEEQLASAMGLGGRDRKAADHSERARDRIRKSIHSSLASIRKNDPSLGHHLTTCIRTGYLCSYYPDPAAR